jgi:hypothetical protein
VCTALAPNRRRNVSRYLSFYLDRTNLDHPVLLLTLVPGKRNRVNANVMVELIRQVHTRWTQKLIFNTYETYITFHPVQLFVCFNESTRRAFRSGTTNFLKLLIGILIYSDPIHLVLWRLRCRHHFTEAISKSASLAIILGIAVVLFTLTIGGAFLRESPL